MLHHACRWLLQRHAFPPSRRSRVSTARWQGTQLPSDMWTRTLYCLTSVEDGSIVIQRCVIRPSYSLLCLLSIAAAAAGTRPVGVDRPQSAASRSQHCSLPPGTHPHHPRQGVPAGAPPRLQDTSRYRTVLYCTGQGQTCASAGCSQLASVS